MKRRNFIKNTLFAAGAISFASVKGENRLMDFPEMPSTSGAKANGFKKSIMWGTVGVPGSVLEKCKAIKAAGFEGIEPNSHMNRNEVLEAMKKTGLVASSVCCSTHWANPLSSPDAAVRQKGVEGMIVALEDAKAYGTDAVLLVPGTVNETTSYDDCWNRSTVEIKKLIPVAEKLGVTICIENVWNNFLLSPLEARQFVDQFNSPYVKFYFDCGNILNYGWPEQWIKILGNKIGRIHIKEFSKELAESKGRRAGFGVKLTEGNVDWNKVMEEARKVYQGVWLTTEQGDSKTQEELTDLSGRLSKIISL